MITSVHITTNVHNMIYLIPGTYLATWCVPKDKISLSSERQLLNRKIGYTVVSNSIHRHPRWMFGRESKIDDQLTYIARWLSMDSLYNLLWPAMAVDRQLAQSIVATDGYRQASRTISCGRQWPSIDISHNLLWLAMAIDRHLAQSFAACNGHRQTSYTIYCGRQWPSIDISHNLLWRPMAIDRHLAQSIVEGNGHRSTRFTIHCVRQCLSIDSVTSLLTPTISIDISPPSSIVEAMDYCWVHCPECAAEQTNRAYALSYDTCSYVFQSGVHTYCSQSGCSILQNCGPVSLISQSNAK